MTQLSIWDKPISHGEILKKAWKHLDLGAIDRHHPFHTPVFGTVAESCEASLRVVVLRRFWRKPPRLAFHSHIGSVKIAEIAARTQVSWLFYHPDEKLQLRIRGRAAIHTDDDLADEQWFATDFLSRRCYSGDAPTQISRKPTSGLPTGLTDRKPTKEESEYGRANFAVISTTIDSLDCTELDVKGNRRSLFTWGPDGKVEMQWLTP